MDTQTSNTPHAAPTPWWKGLMIASGLCCLILWGASWLLSDDGQPKASEPRPHYLTKAERREEKRRMEAEERRLGLSAKQFWVNYEVRNLTVAPLERKDKDTTTQEPIKKAQPPSPITTLPPVNLNAETINPLMREKLRLHEDLVRNLLN